MTPAVYAEGAKPTEKSFFQKISAMIFPEKEEDVSPKPVRLSKKTGKPTETENVTVKHLPEISMGRKDATVTMINYSSLSCGHCAHFNDSILPEIEKKYLKPGHLRIIFRDYPGDQVTLKAHQIAWCKGEMRYLDIVKVLFENQEQWLTAEDPVAALKTIALKSGITSQQFDSCLKNQELLDQIIGERLEGQKKYNITATPTIVINSKIYQQELSLKEFDDIMKPLIKSDKKQKNWWGYVRAAPKWDPETSSGWQW